MIEAFFEQLSHGKWHSCRARYMAGHPLIGELIRSRQKLMVRRVSILSSWMVHCPLFTLQDAETAAQLGFLLMECIWGSRIFRSFEEVTPIASCQFLSGVYPSWSWEYLSWLHAYVTYVAQIPRAHIRNPCGACSSLEVHIMFTPNQLQVKGGYIC